MTKPKNALTTKWLNANVPKLAKRYPQQWVAVSPKGRVVAHDFNSNVLIGKVSKKYGAKQADISILYMQPPAEKITRQTPPTP